MTVQIIYCSSGNYILQNIAENYGFEYGLRLPYNKSNDKQLYFADQDWKNPNKNLYIHQVSIYKPKLATIMDIEHRFQLNDALDWGNKISHFVETIIMIPKCTGIINKLPRQINGKNVILGYSVPSKYGKTKLNTNLFKGWKIHLLGGSPERQILFSNDLDVISIDCNYHSMKANKFGEYWTGKKDGNTRWWKKLDSCFIGKNRSLKAFELSCKNISEYWDNYS